MDLDRFLVGPSRIGAGEWIRFHGRVVDGTFRRGGPRHLGRAGLGRRPGIDAEHRTHREVLPGHRAGHPDAGALLLAAPPRGPAGGRFVAVVVGIGPDPDLDVGIGRRVGARRVAGRSGHSVRCGCAEITFCPG